MDYEHIHSEESHKFTWLEGQFQATGVEIYMQKTCPGEQGYSEFSTAESLWINKK